MLVSAAETSLLEEDTAGALQKAQGACAIFKEVRDVTGTADALRLVVGAHVQRDDHQAANDILDAELQGFRDRGERYGEAAMLLSRAEVATSLAGTLSCQQSDEGIQSAVQARSIFGELGDTKMQAAALIAQASAYLRARTKQQQKDEGARALAAGQEALSLSKQLKDSRLQAKALHALAVTSAQQDAIEDAMQYTREALALWKDLEDRRSEALETHMIAQVQLQDTRPLESAASAQDAIAILQEARTGRGHEVSVLATLVAALLQQKETEQAIRTAERRIAYYQSEEDLMSEALALNSLFAVFLAQDDAAEAIRTADKALIVLRSMPQRSRKSRQLEAQVLHNMADAYMAEQDYAQAEEVLERSLSILKDVEDFNAQIQAYCTYSYVSMHLGEWRDAIRAAQDSRDVSRQEGDRLQEGVALLALCCALSGKGDQRRAAAAGQEAQELFYEEENARAEANAVYMLCNVYISSSDHSQAMASARKSQMMYREIGRRQDECNAALLAAHAGFFAALAEGAPDPATKPSEVWQKSAKVAEEALALSRRLDSEVQVGKCLLGVAQVHAMTNRQSECQQCVDEAVQLAEKHGHESLEAYALTLNAQMFWVSKQEDLCPPLATRAHDLFQKVGDAAGAKLAKEMTGLTAEGIVDAGDSTAAVEAYSGPTEEMLLATVNEVALSLIGNESIMADTPLMDAGLDSLASVEFQNTLQKEFKGASLPSTLVFDYPTPKDIAQFINTGLVDAYKRGK